jgi:hypothetical protein
MKNKQTHPNPKKRFISLVLEINKPVDVALVFQNHFFGS